MIERADGHRRLLVHQINTSAFLPSGSVITGRLGHSMLCTATEVTGLCHADVGPLRTSSGDDWSHQTIGGYRRHPGQQALRRLNKPAPPDPRTSV
ncbi:hypothetical protein AGRA3207_007401 [Actinomadura graeca]|uniref:Uncharacterized protein n=1 Tax=Actinomadura graeca TaxID=2750812 RepID=A0ABX8R431_9ACTN|nr:hypothetical protein [Actinomadura graeca]QXJ25840.1 hypothetical protein AGRA3207_007401 [Actinomadura graeca]